MSLVNNDVLPLELHKRPHADAHTLEGGDTHVELVGLQLGPQDLLSAVFRCDEVANAHLGQPELELSEPVAYHGLRHNDEEVAVDFPELAQKADERNGLYCFSKPHLVGQDSINTRLVKTNHPVQPVHLIVSQLAAFQNRGLHHQTSERALLLLTRTVFGFSAGLLLSALRDTLLSRRRDARFLLVGLCLLLLFVVLEILLQDELGVGLGALKQFVKAILFGIRVFPSLLR